MSYQEVERVSVIASVTKGQLTQAKAACELHLSVRQISRLVHAYRIEGTQGLVSKRRGKRPNNAIDTALHTEALALVRTRYADFGATLAHEKLTEEHGLRFSVETVRQWMDSRGAVATQAPAVSQGSSTPPPKAAFWGDDPD